MLTEEENASVLGLERPHGNLLKLYVLQSLLLGPLFPLVLLPMLFRFKTLRYRFDEQGVSMRWGVLFRREVSLNYARIQDIHLSSHFVERWLGLARVQVQTASGSAAAEMVIEGFQEFELVRDFLYTRMRGAKGLSEPDEGRPGVEGVADAVDSADFDDVVAALRAATDELRALRQAVAPGSGGQPAPPPALPNLPQPPEGSAS